MSLFTTDLSPRTNVMFTILLLVNFSLLSVVITAGGECYQILKQNQQYRYEQQAKVAQINLVKKQLETVTVSEPLVKSYPLYNNVHSDLLVGSEKIQSIVEQNKTSLTAFHWHNKSGVDSQRQLKLGVEGALAPTLITSEQILSQSNWQHIKQLEFRYGGNMLMFHLTLGILDNSALNFELPEVNFMPLLGLFNSVTESQACVLDLNVTEQDWNSALPDSMSLKGMVETEFGRQIILSVYQQLVTLGIGDMWAQQDEELSIQFDSPSTIKIIQGCTN